MDSKALADVLSIFITISLLVLIISVPTPNIIAFMLLFIPAPCRRRRYIAMMCMAFIVTGISDIASIMLIHKAFKPADMMRYTDDLSILYLWVIALSLGFIAIAVNVYVRLNICEE